VSAITGFLANVLLVDATMPEAQRALVRDALMAANISLLPGEPR